MCGGGGGGRRGVGRNRIRSAAVKGQGGKGLADGVVTGLVVIRLTHLSDLGWVASFCSLH